MPIIAIILLLSLGVVSCGTATDNRYRDTAMLERPPKLAVSPQAREQSRTADDNRAEKKLGVENEGAATIAYMTTTTPPLLIIKQPYDQAWDTLGHALKQDTLKVTERKQDKGLYFVTYDLEAQSENESGFLDKTVSLFQDKPKEEHYILTVRAKGEETQISAAVNNAPKQSEGSENKDDASAPPEDGPEKLLLSIYKTMSDKPQNDKEEKKSRHRHKDQD
jgi:uncharacterized lipoprotein